MGFHYDGEALFPKYHADVDAGRALVASCGEIEAAQDRVAMRRHIRNELPVIATALNLRDMGELELATIITEMRA